MNNLIIEIPISYVQKGDAVMESNVLFLKLAGELLDVYFILSCTDTICTPFVSEVYFAIKS